MKTMRRFARIAGVAGVCLLPAASLAAAGSETALQQKIDRCHQVSDPSARLACYEGLVSAGAGAPMASGAEPGAPQAAPVIAATDAPEADVAAAAPPTAQAAPPVDVRSAATSGDLVNGNLAKVTLSVGRAAMTKTNMLRMVTSDGAVWTQTEAHVIRAWPASGTKVTIRRNFMGGYWCRVSRRDNFPCKPDRDSIKPAR